MIIRRAREVPDIVLIISPSYELRFRRFNSSRVQNEKIYNIMKDVNVTASHVIGDVVMKGNVIIYTQIDINYAAGGNLRVLSAEEAWETIEDCAQCDKQWKNPTSTIPDQTIANLKTQLVENEVVRVKIPKCMAWLDDEPIRDLNTMEDKVDNPSPQSTPQVLLSFEVYTPPATHLEEVEETIGILMEVEPLDHMKLEDLSLDTSTHDIFLSSKGFPSVDELEP
ncbi:hypothetical protein Tco_0991269 [Tanacetum coccineum]|uniref:Uncharacterized protein n=1 Tax=Tanacetum coccineum TaxID=301880 RepID=A0ABQ5EZ15_9ASTR